MNERERRNYEIEPPDSLPRGALAEELRARVVPARVTDPEEQRRILKRVTTGLRTSARFADVADELSRGWPEPLDR